MAKKKEENLEEIKNGEKINKEEKVTTMMVTHDAKVASYSDRILYLVDGSIAGEFNNLYRDENGVREFLASFRW